MKLLLLLLSLSFVPMTVTETVDDVVYITDCKGNEFSFFGDGYEVGDKVKALMYGAFTREFEDDEVLFVERR